MPVWARQQVVADQYQNGQDEKRTRRKMTAVEEGATNYIVVVGGN